VKRNPGQACPPSRISLALNPGYARCHSFGFDEEEIMSTGQGGKFMPIEPVTLSSAASLISKLAPLFVEPSKGIAARTKEKLEVKFRRGFSRYIEENIARFSTIKTIISSSSPISLTSLYVNLYLAHPEHLHRDEDFLKEINTYKSVLFTAIAGAGKSMLMRYLYLRFLETQTDRLPIFIELRELNQNPTVTLESHVCSRIGDYIEGFSSEQLRYALGTGRIILFLDGFDEINFDKRQERERQVNELAARFGNLLMFVSSRPAESFKSWEKFYVFDVQPFTKKQVELLIDNIPYDPDIKTLFRRKLSEGLYDTHKEFLRNPLLTIMMLITLAQFAEVPAKIHLFYEYAFEALFGRHDVTKAGFQRKRHTSLALDDFKRLFSYFCMITYARQLITFSTEKVLEFVQQSISSSQISVDKVSFMNDLTESTCMLVLDGLDFTFSHRSFQEYFAAYFLSRVKVDEFEKAIPKLVQRATFDGVIQMISEMNREKFEEAWALPWLKRLYESVKDIDAEEHCVAFGAALFDVKPELLISDSEAENKMMMILSDDGNFGLTDRDSARIVLYHVYGVFPKIHYRLNSVRDADTKMLSKIRSGELLGSDQRFKELRRRGKKDKSIAITDEDSVWYRDTYFGNFLRIESGLLKTLYEEVRHRVEERMRGLSEIFPQIDQQL
jgi:hypothetical protein